MGNSPSNSRSNSPATKASARLTQNTALHDAPTAGASPATNEKLFGRVRQVLSEDRERPSRIMFQGYQPSEEHKLRMAGLPARLRIPRSSWASHPNYKGRLQMPNFHHDFRQYMQAIIALLVDAADPSLNVIAQLSRDVHERRQRSPQEAQPASSAAE